MSDSVNKQVTSAQGVFRMERIKELHGERAAEAVAKEMKQAEARKKKWTPFQKAQQEAADAALIDMIRKNILSILPIELRGLCENIPTSANVNTANPRLTAYYQPSTEADGIPGTYWGSPSAGAAASVYQSFFKVWATTVGSSVTIGVKDGSTVATLPDGKCGEVRVNNTELYVDGYYEDFETANSNYAAYLLCWVDELLGNGAEVVILNSLDSKPSAPSRADPAPANIVSHGFIYLGRVSVDAAFNPTVNQDYLQGGTAQIVMLGPCGGDVALYLQQGGE